MGMLIACAKGCGHTIEVTTAQIDEAVKHGAALVVEHDVCPTDPTATMRRFKVVTQVFELKDEVICEGTAPVETPELLSSIGHTVEAGSFKLAVEPLSKELTRQWGFVVGMADSIDQPLDPDDTPSDQQ